MTGGVALRTALAVATAALTAVTWVLFGVPVGVIVVASAVVALAVAAYPSTPVTTLVLLVGVALYAFADGGFSWWLLPVSSLVYTVHLLAGIAAAVPARASGEWAALAPSGRRWLLVHAVTMPVLAGLVLVLP